MDIKFNTKIKVYGLNNYSITYCNRKIFKPKQKNKPNNNIKNTITKKNKIESKLENILRSQKRAKERIFDIVVLNKWDYFCTFTFDPHKVDSYSSIDVMHKVKSWFSYQHKFHGMSYILVPEFHRSGRIHIHALIVLGCLKVIDSGKTNKHGDKIYNIGAWRYGWSTAEPIYGSQIQLAHYVTKYISKDIVKIFGKYYWSSRNLIRDVPTQYCNSNFEVIDSTSYTVPGVPNLLLKYENHLHYDTKK